MPSAKGCPPGQQALQHPWVVCPAHGASGSLATHCDHLHRVMMPLSAPEAWPMQRRKAQRPKWKRAKHPTSRCSKVRCRRVFVHAGWRCTSRSMISVPARCAAALSKFVPDKEMREVFRTEDTSKLRFSDLPATSKLVCAGEQGLVRWEPRTTAATHDAGWLHD